MAFIAPEELFKGSRIGNSRLVGHYFIGTVVDNNDPLKIGRVRVRVKDLHGSQIKDDDLPWASPNRSFGLGANGALGSYFIPNQNAKVIVVFSRGSIYSPIYIGSPYSIGDIWSQISTNYPNRYGFVDENNNHIYVDRTNNQTVINLASGFTLTIFSDGHFEMNAPVASTITTPLLNIDGGLHVTGNIDGDAEVNDSVRSMSADRTIYNSHDHNISSGSSAPGPTAAPNQSQ